MHITFVDILLFKPNFNYETVVRLVNGSARFLFLKKTNLLHRQFQFFEFTELRVFENICVFFIAHAKRMKIVAVTKVLSQKF